MSTLEGNTLGLKANQIKRLEKLYQRRLPPTALVTQEFARQMTELSAEIRRQVGVLINRQGQVEYVMVGDARGIVIPDVKRVRVGQGRFRGLRCIHTQLTGEGLTQDDLTDLALLRLDLMAVVSITSEGLPGWIHAAHLVPASPQSKIGNPVDSVPADEELFGESSPQPSALSPQSSLQPWAFLPKVHPSQLDVDFLELIEALEAEFARTRGQRSARDKRDRALLVGVTTDSLALAQESMAELEELARSSGLVVVDALVQKRPQLDPNTVIGKGKLQDLIIRSLQLTADIIIFDRDLSPSQIRSIEAATDLKVIDRTQLILDIFAQRAQSREGKIQVELAQLKYLLPRLTGKGADMSRLEGGIGGRGPGETKLEVDRRRARDRITALERLLTDIRRNRNARRARRTKRDVPVVSIVGYTNAGKSTLLNTLTASEVLAESRMFATLDPTSRRLRLPREQEIVINDTVGFIRDLPETLIAAFKATLEEMEDSDLLIHLVDAQAPDFERHIEAVQSILSDLNLSKLPRILVFNKCDGLPVETISNLCHSYGAVGISALRRETLTPLLNEIDLRLGKLLTAASAGNGHWAASADALEEAEPPLDYEVETV
ncbi:MAG: GTPase HflX [Blastocatellia bacterium]|nr:GTPase HflX [Blastocatellia bacterium]